ncbi:MAG: pyridoxamine 5'-phosphate oxidase family protein [Actinomycetota bacterium]|nr:pyridoxamine 5'-phosphate oxidase family protein [Actinomycetota bacterium]MDZ4180061.1 pyridoxamine 5'-phosphate oxidase family protein [Coriobacteriia bacterium]
MRRTDRQITDEATIDRILRAGRYATVALARGDEPYVVTLSYGYDAPSRTLYFHVAHEGRKLDFIAANPKACATVVLDGGYVNGECEHPFQSVVMCGTMRMLEGAEEKIRAIHSLVDHLEENPKGYWDSRSWDIGTRLDGFTALAFSIDTLDAKSGK